MTFGSKPSEIRPRKCDFPLPVSPEDWLKVDETNSLELRHEKGNALNTLELNEEQPKRVEGGD